MSGSLPLHVRLRAALLFGEAGVLPALFLLLVVLLALTQPYFLAGQNIVNVLRNAAFLIIAASGQMLVLIVGGFDLSIGAVIALTSVVSASVMAGLPGIGVHATGAIVALGVLAGFGCGLAVGLANAVSVAVLRVPPFMATLGSMSIANGLGLLLTNGIPVYGMPDGYVAVVGRARSCSTCRSRSTPPSPWWSCCGVCSTGRGSAATSMPAAATCRRHWCRASTRARCWCWPMC